MDLKKLIDSIYESGKEAQLKKLRESREAALGGYKNYKNCQYYKEKEDGNTL